MTQLSDREQKQLQDLLRHASEFIAYFELAETKLAAWRHQQETSFYQQKENFEQQQKAIQKDIENFKATLSDDGLIKVQTQVNQTLQALEKKVGQVEETRAMLADIFDSEKQSLTRSIQKFKEEVDLNCQKTVDNIESQLSHYDVDHFRRIANESCDQVEQFAQNAVRTSSKMLRHFQWGTVVLVLVTTFVTSLMIGMYISNEWPWEVHQQALNEREAGKVLIKAWPRLSQLEKRRILINEPGHMG